MVRDWQTRFPTRGSFYPSSQRLRVGMSAGGDDHSCCRGEELSTPPPRTVPGAQGDALPDILQEDTQTLSIHPPKHSRHEAA